MFEYNDSSALFWILPSLVLKRMLMGNFTSDKLDRRMAESIDFMVERVSTYIPEYNSVVKIYPLPRNSCVSVGYSPATPPRSSLYLVKCMLFRYLHFRVVIITLSLGYDYVNKSL